jgi:hypothetical protein
VLAVCSEAPPDAVVVSTRASRDAEAPAGDGGTEEADAEARAADVGTEEADAADGADETGTAGATGTEDTGAPEADDDEADDDEAKETADAVAETGRA